MKPVVIAFALNLIVSATAAPAWPQFRGPNSTGIAEDSKPPQKFGPADNVLWQIDLPYSPSSPCIWDDHIFIATFDQGKLQVRDYRRTDGENRWARGFTVPAFEEFHKTEGSPAASTPVTDGRVVVTYFGSFGLVCQTVNGTVVWTQSMPPARTAGAFGSGTSPIIHSNKVILNRDIQGNSAIMAFDLASGKKLWETARPGAFTSYTTPAIWCHGQRPEILVAGSMILKAYDLQTGAERWSLRGLPASTCTTPVVTPDMIYFAGWAPGKSDSPWPGWETVADQHDKNKDGKITSDEVNEEERATFMSFDQDNDSVITAKDWDLLGSYIQKGENSLLAIKPGGEGDLTEKNVAWKATRGLPYVASPLFYRGNVYTIKDGGMLSCFDAKTGEVRYEQERIDAQGNYYASPVAADGRIFLASVKGRVTVVKAGGEKPEILHQADFNERIAATMAILDDKIYLRTQTKLYAFGTAASK